MSFSINDIIKSIPTKENQIPDIGGVVNAISFGFENIQSTTNAEEEQNQINELQEDVQEDHEYTMELQECDNENIFHNETYETPVIEVPKAFESDTISKTINLEEEKPLTKSDIADASKAKAKLMAAEIMRGFDKSSVIAHRNVTGKFTEFLLDKVSETLHSSAYDIQMLSQLKNDIIAERNPEDDTEALENLRVFSKGAFQSRGVFYCLEPLDLTTRYRYLQDTSVMHKYNMDLYTDRYIYNICLPDGKVFAHMGYNVGTLLSDVQAARKVKIIHGLNDANPFDKNKYQISAALWVNQGNILGNMESLNLYEGRIVYCVEGYFDALRINDEFKSKSVAMLNSTMTRSKLRILQYLKNTGHYLVYVPDMDEAGLSNIIKHPIWDEVYTLPRYNLKNINNKDVDNYVKTMYLSDYFKETDVDLSTVAITNINVHDTTKIKIPFHQVSLETKLTIANRLMKGGFA